MKMTFQMGPIFVCIVFLENNMRNFMAYYNKKNSSSTIVKKKKILFWSLLLFQFIYESEQKAAEHDIFDEIKKGVRLKHVRTNDRSKPNLQGEFTIFSVKNVRKSVSRKFIILSGIRSFRRQLTKEERLKSSISMEEPIFEDDDSEDMVALRDDLESTKQLLELEVRSKKLLEKDNKRLVAELEKLRAEMSNKAGNPNDSVNEANEECGIKARRNSVANKRHSIIRLLSDSENKDAEQDAISAMNNTNK